jgi:hypothetical protein
VFAIDGWSWSKSADAVWESIDDWVASAANEEVVSWYLRDITISVLERNVGVTYNLRQTVSNSERLA